MRMPTSDHRAGLGQLESDRHAHGTTVRRVYPQSAHEIFIAVRHPDGSRMLTLGVGAHAVPVTCCAGCTNCRAPAGWRCSSPGWTATAASCASSSRTPACGRCSTRWPATSPPPRMPNPAPPTRCSPLSGRFEHWRQMLQSLADSGLTPESRRGLFGELTFLRDYLLAILPADEAVRAWTGPTAAHQDFQLPGAAIEVKTSSGKEPQTLVISNERELDDTGMARLILAHFSLDERRGGNGESLNAIVDRTRDLVTDARRHEDVLDDLLVRAGYLQQQRELYDEPRYTVRKQRFWHVTGDFPRITEADLRPGVGDCSTASPTAGLEQYAMTAEDVLAAS